MTDSVLPADPAPTPPPRGWKRWLRWIILVAGLIGMALVAREATGADGSAFPSGQVLAGSFVLQLGAGIAAAHAWSTLLGTTADGPVVRAAMFESQLGKYVPGGGVLQAAGQVALSTTTGLSTRRSGVAWATSMVLTVISGLSIMGVFALAGGFEGWIRLVAVAGVVSLVVADRRVLAAVLHRAHRLSSRIPEPELLPSQPQLVVGLLWTVLAFGLNAVSFTVVMVNLDSAVRPVAVVPAFCAAWLAGFLLVPLPAGLGVREAILVALIPGSSTGLVVGASLSQRIMTLAAEVTLVVGHRLARWRRRPGADRSVSDERPEPAGGP